MTPQMLTPQQLAALQINTRQLQSMPGGWAQQEAERQAVVDKLPSSTLSPVAQQLASTDYSSPVQLLTPLQRQDAQARGFPTNASYLTDMRMAKAGVKGALGLNVTFNNATAQDLERDSRFKKLYQDDPERAAKLFTAVTGNDFKTYTDSKLAVEKERTKFQTDTVQKKLASGDWTIRDGKIMSRKLVPNPSGTGEMILGNDYSELDEFERTLINPKTQANVIDPDIARRRELALKAAATAPTAPAARKVATLQKTGQAPVDSGMRLGLAMNNAVNAVGVPLANFASNIQDTYEAEGVSPALAQMLGAMNPIPGMVAKIPGVADIGNEYQNVRNNIWNAFVPAMQAVGGNAEMRQRVDMPMERGQDPRRMRATLQNSPHFQQLLKDDPQRAMALVAAMQNQ